MKVLACASGQHGPFARFEGPAAGGSPVLMSNEPNHVLKFSTDMLPERDRYDAFREEFARQVTHLDVQREEKGSFYAHFSFATLGALNCGSVDFSPASYGRTPELLTDGNDDFVLFINRGSAIHESRKDQVTAHGGAILQDNSQAGRVSSEDVGSLLNIRIPRKLLMSVVPTAEDLVGSAINPNSTALRLLHNYVAMLLDDSTEQPQTLAVAGQHIVDLIALAIADNAETAAMRTSIGLKAARTLAVRRSIQERLGDPELSLALIAKVNGISERYVQALLEEQDTSLTDYVLEQRLALAHRLLSNPMHRQRRISDIAYGAGFSDLSHFNRSFRRRYGRTPSEVRVT